jgi:hypothetical protein
MRVQQKAEKRADSLASLHRYFTVFEQSSMIHKQHFDFDIPQKFQPGVQASDPDK